MVSNDAEKGKGPKGKRFIDIGVSLFISGPQESAVSQDDMIPYLIEQSLTV
jgi:hypothetical protein